MKRALLLLLVSGCPGPDHNPVNLYLAPKDSETHVELVDHEPPPF